MKGKKEEHPPIETPEQAGFIRQWAFRYMPGENRVMASLRSWFRILFIITHEFNETAISLRASALTYSIVLSMVPMLAMSTAVLKGLGSDNQLRIAAYKFIDQLEPEQQRKTPDAAGAAGQFLPDLDSREPTGDRPSAEQESILQENLAAQGPVPEQKSPESLTTHLRNAVDTIFDYVDRTNFAALGAFGIIGLLLTVILVLS
ncbi:MAG: YihY/virulence factor BrkB family protein, partial [Desulfobulbaceae bacterium]|nr:YihY/virulence factor BrkB family protein [Desulfobulbaceae bacterium]